MSKKMEFRTVVAEDLRAEQTEDKKPRLVGYAALFNTEAVIGDMFRESIRKGAFSRPIKEKQDVRALLNHDENYVFGRTKSGTLTLEEDDKGLRMELDPPDTQWAKDIITSVNRGDIDQMSFSFIPKKVEWQAAREDGGLDLREIVDVDLRDVAIVTFPAYEGTSVSTRSADDVYEEYKASKEEQVPSEDVSESASQPVAARREIEIERLR